MTNPQYAVGTNGATDQRRNVYRGSQTAPIAQCETIRSAQWLAAHLNGLDAENARLREALQKIVSFWNETPGTRTRDMREEYKDMLEEFARAALAVERSDA